ncbi:MAG: UvrD-helicase domain-containing protein [Ignavibacteriaceae bacterium]
MAALTTYQEKALDYRKHISLTANAGSGKTFVLSKRYLRIAIDENIPLRNIAAITFTDKAAGELYKKIAIQIEENLRTSENVEEKRKLEYIRRQLVSANISTIHSFCIDILKEHPVEAGLDANFTAIDEQTSDELIELSVEEMIKSSIKNLTEADNLKYLIRIFASKSLFAGEIIALIKNRKIVLNFSQSIYSKPEIEIAEFFHNTFIEYADKIIIQRLNNFIFSIKEVNNGVLNYKPDHKIAIEVKSLIEKLVRLKKTAERIKCLFEIKDVILKKDGGIKSRDYISDKLRDNLQDSILFLEGYFDELNYFAIEEDYHEIEIELAKFGKTLIDFFNLALENYTKEKHENGYMDYEDILIYTQKILELETVREDVSNKFNYIMIDEYQDTNEIQYKIFLPILDQLKKGNLFVVGDEKQSIYMFRDAELEIFDRTKKNIEAMSGKEALLTLPDSFRMAPAICLFTNLLFGNLFEYPNIIYNEVGPSDLVCARKDEVIGGIEILLSSSEAVAYNESGINSDQEAETVAKRILHLIKTGTGAEKITWHDVAILCRKRKSFAELEKAFIKYNIPFLIVGGKGFFQRQTIYDIYNYFSFLSDEKNDTALIGILRSPFFSLSDSVIFEISLIQGDSYCEKLKRYGSNNPEIEHITDILSENLSLAKNYDIPFLMRKILNESDILAVIANKPNGVQELANIEKLVKITINFFSKGFKTLYDYVNYLKDSIELSEDESQAAIAEEINSVNIMTFHQAKGLEFSAVFLYKCDGVSSKNITKSKRVSANKNFGLLTKLPLGNRYSAEYKSAPIIGLSNLIIRKKELAEIKRLLYVGITRAKSYLFISGNVKQNKNFAGDSFMGLLEKGLNIDFDSDKLLINSNLKFLDLEKNDYYIKNMDVNIPIIKEIDKVEQVKAKVEPAAQKKFIGKNISDISEGEIISATKLSVYKQCPLKYHLTYDLGFASLYNQYRKWRTEKATSDRYEFNEFEDERLTNAQESEIRNTIKEFADVKGRVIHKILQKEVPAEKVEESINSFLKDEVDSFDIDKKVIYNLIIEIKNDLTAFFESNLFKEISKFQNYKNEFEVYAKENNYYLYGIIDRLIFTEDKAVIIDYKTDLLKSNEYEGKINSYYTQLSFYSYIISKLFNKINKYEIQLIFIKYPGRILKKEIGNEDFEKISNEIKKMVRNTREQIYSKNLNHCKNCSYSANFKDCIII